MSEFVRARRLAAGLVGLSLLAAAVASGVTPSAATTGPCGGLTPPANGSPSYSHIVVVMDENVSYATFQKTADAPYLHALASQCGSETFMHAATHPSQPNYMAATSGKATGVGVHTANANIFQQAQAHSDTWKSYEESMPASCAANSGFYKSGHNPAFWYTNLRSPSNTCLLYDVPLAPALDTDIENDSLPSFSWITPNACNDMHGLSSCSQPSSQRIAVGDAWLSDLIPRLTALPSYQAGQTLILVVWDEGNGAGPAGADCTDPAVYSNQPSCRIPTIVVSPYVQPGVTDSGDHNLYALLGDMEDILGYPRLGRAVGQPSMRPGLGF